MLSWLPLVEHFGIQESGLQTDMVNARLANDNAGPTSYYVHAVRHPRYKGHSIMRWSNDFDLQVEGDQAKGAIQYILLDRANKDCTIWVNAEQLGWPGQPTNISNRKADEFGVKP